MPIHHDPLNPTLTLNSPNPRHKNIILTAPRTTDALATISAFADPAVYLYLVGPPFPYTQESFDSQFQVLDPATRTAVGELWDAKVEVEKGGIEERKWEDRKWVGSGLPFPTIREVVVGEDGQREERFLGGLGVRRRGYATVLDEEEKERLARENNERKVGDPGTEWEVGFWLLPSHHGLGIMPAILRTLIDDFCIPYMNMHRLVGEHHEYNEASRRVFEKCGFVNQGITEGVRVVVEGKREALGRMLEVEGNWGEKGQGWARGEKLGVGCLRWERRVEN